MSCATTQTPRTLSIEDLSLDEKIGQMFAAEAYGVYMSASSPAYQRLERLVRELHIGGFVWFTANVYETAALNRRLQAMTRVPLLVSADLEAGMGMRFADTWYWPPAMAVAATGDPSLAEKEGRQVAKEARAVGINHILAPVGDVNVNPDNTVINARSFGEDPEDVSRFVTAFIRGVRAEGLLTTVKHFPGHGDTKTDSHRSLPILDVTRERLDAVELRPFKAAIDAGVDSVMIGHLALPAIDPTPAPVRTDLSRNNPYQTKASEIPENATLPATVSQKIIGDLLRKDLGFRGLVITDAFDMGGLTTHFDAGEAAVRAIEAGEDQILMPANADEAIAAVREAVRSGRISVARIDESVRRILEAKQRVPHTVAEQDELFTIVDSAASREIASEIATKAITLVRASDTALPLAKDARVLHLVITDFIEAVHPLTGFDGGLRRRLSTPPVTLVLDSRSTQADADQVLAAASNADVVVLGLAIRAKSGYGRLAMPAVAADTVRRLSEIQRKMIGLSFGTPYLLREMPFLETYLCAYGPQPALQSAAARALFGEAPVTGRLPVTIPGLHQRGEGISK